VTSDKRNYIESLKLVAPYLTSEFTGILNADDLSEKDRLKNQISILKSEGLDVCVGRLIKFKGLRWCHVPSLTRSQGRGSYCPHMLYLGPIYADASWVTRRETFKKLFDTNFRSDWGIALEYFQCLKIGFDFNSKYYYRQHSDQTTRSFALSFQEECNLIQREILSKFDLSVTSNFVECIATPWKMAWPIEFNDFEVSSAYLRKIHKEHCHNSKSFDLEMIRRLLIAALNPRNPRKGFRSFRIVAMYPLQSIKLFKDILVSILLQTARTR
jgi:hypothetical protein